MAGSVRRRLLVAIAVALILVALWPLLKANATARQHAWELGCAGQGGAIRTLPADRSNPLVVTSGKPSYECRDVHGVLLSRR